MTIRYTTDIEEIKNSRDYNLKKANSFKQLLDEILKVDMILGLASKETIEMVLEKNYGLNIKNKNFQEIDKLAGQYIPEYSSFLKNINKKNTDTGFYFVIFENKEYDFFQAENDIVANLYVIKKFKENNLIFKNFYAVSSFFEFTNYAPREMGMCGKGTSINEIIDIFNVGRNALFNFTSMGVGYKSMIDVLTLFKKQNLKEIAEELMKNSRETINNQIDMDKLELTKDFLMELKTKKDPNFVKEDGSLHFTNIARHLNLNYMTLKKYIGILDKRCGLKISSHFIKKDDSFLYDTEKFQEAKELYQRALKNKNTKFIKNNGELNISAFARELNFAYNTTKKYINLILAEK